MNVIPFDTIDPVPPDYYDRAVFRRPPPCFSVEMLSPNKHRGNVGYRMLISSNDSDTASCFSSASRSSYEIWRRWSDCLTLQDTLEVEYGRMARSKKRRLVAGKGIKKNGIYIHDRASSFESLPNGPDPSSVHLDIHHYLPKLTKKSSMFGVRQATVNQRQKEVEALIEQLFSPEAPALLHELRQVTSVTEFFGFWRKDHNRMLDLNSASPVKSCGSVSNSVFSLQLSPVLGQDIPPRQPSPSHSPSILSSLSTPPPSSGNTLISGFDSCSIASSGDSGGSESPLIVLSEESPAQFGQWPELGSSGRPEDRLMPDLRTLPDKRDGIGSDLTVSPTTRIRQVVRGPRENRRGRIFPNPPKILPVDPQNDPGVVFTSDKDSVYASNPSERVSMISASDYLEQLGLLLGHPDEDQSFRNSVATFRTTCSADAIIPRLPSYINLVQSLCESPKNRPGSLSEDLADELADIDPLTTICDGPSSHESSPSHPSFGDYTKSNSVRLSNFFRPRSNSSTSSSSFSSSTTSTWTSNFCSPKAQSFAEEPLVSPVFSSPPTSPTSTLTIKAALDDSIIVLRVPRTICFDEIRQRLYDKFVRQEGASLSESFTFARVMTISTSPTGSVFAHRRLQSDSFPAAGDTDSIQMSLITSQQQWEEAIRGVTGFEKLTLHIFRNSS